MSPHQRVPNKKNCCLITAPDFFFQIRRASCQPSHHARRPSLRSRERNKRLGQGIGLPQNVHLHGHSGGPETLQGCDCQTSAMEICTKKLKDFHALVRFEINLLKLMECFATHLGLWGRVRNCRTQLPFPPSYHYNSLKVHKFLI